MPLSAYEVLLARAVDCRREGSGDTPHYQIHAVDEGGVDVRVAVNVQSQLPPSELLYLVDDNLSHPVTATVDGFGSGWQPLASGPGGPNLDYIRANLFDREQMRPLPPDVSGPDNDLADLLDHYMRRAIKEEPARLYAFGQRWGPEAAVQDKVFGFRPGNGVHDIHMNQGNSGAFRRDDGVWQDGGLLLHFPAATRWVGIFLAFQSQAWHTDDTTGHAIDDVPPDEGEAAVIEILAAMVNPLGPAPERETVLLLNASPEAVDLTRWRIADRMKHTCPLPAGPLAAGSTLQVPVEDEVRLGDKCRISTRARATVPTTSAVASVRTTLRWRPIWNRGTPSLFSATPRSSGSARRARCSPPTSTHLNWRASSTGSGVTSASGATTTTSGATPRT